MHIFSEKKRETEDKTHQECKTFHRKEGPRVRFKMIQDCVIISRFRNKHIICIQYNIHTEDKGSEQIEENKIPDKRLERRDVISDCNKIYPSPEKGGMDCKKMVETKMNKFRNAVREDKNS